jgi:DNA-3-methyladenine glycosylase I
MTLRRCTWPRTELDTAYHDTEWGVPVHTDGKLFELLTLEGAQAGLSWSIILRKREAYRRAFAEFDAERVARFTPSRLERLLRDPGIVRNRLKIESTVTNARAFLHVQKEDGSFSAYVWSFVEGRPQVSQRRAMGDLPTRSAVSDAMSASLKKRGFRFVGSTICYAFMQAAGLVNDHLVDCFRFRELAEASDESRRARA